MISLLLGLPRETLAGHWQIHLTSGSCQIWSSCPRIGFIKAKNYINLGSTELQQFVGGSTFTLSEKGELEAKPKMLHEHVTNIDRWTDDF